MRIKLYIARGQKVKSNMDKLYGVVIGQCSDALLSVLNNNIEYITKDEECDIIWLLEKLKTITLGLDSKSNKRSNLHDALKILVKMQQGPDESDDTYMKRFKANIDTLISAGGRHILCSETIMDKASTNLTDVEIIAEEENFKAMMYLKQSDKSRHGRLIGDLQNGAYVDCDEYPTTLAGAYDLMIRRSGVFTSFLNNSGDRFRPGRGFFGRDSPGRGGGRGSSFSQLQD